MLKRILRAPALIVRLRPKTREFCLYFTLILAPGDHIEEVAAIDYFDWLRHFTDLIGTTPQGLSMIRDAYHTRKCIKRARTRS
jgi:hypothetical protein